MIVDITRMGRAAGEMDIPDEVLKAADIVRDYLLSEPNCAALNGVMLKPSTGKEYTYPLSYKALRAGK